MVGIIKNHFYRYGLIFFFVLTSSCSTQQKFDSKTRNMEFPSLIYNYSFDDVWAVALDQFKKYDWQIVDKDSGIIKSRWIDNLEEHEEFNTGKVFDNDVKSSRFKLFINIDKLDDKRDQTTKVTIYKKQMVIRNYDKGFEVYPTDEVLENVIFYRIKRVLEISAIGKIDNKNQESEKKLIRRDDLPEAINLKATTNYEGDIILNWNNPTEKVYGYRLAYKMGKEAPWTCLNGIDVRKINFKRISGLMPNTNYSFRLCSYNADKSVSHGVLTSAKTERDGDDIPPVFSTDTKAINPSSSKHNSLSLIGFYSISAGSYAEKLNGSDVAIKSSQNSPATFELMGNYTPRTSGYMYSSGLYISKLSAGLSNNSTEVNVPYEIGFNFYINRALSNFTLYGGMDYEKFSSFYIDELSRDFALKSYEHTLTYGTLGISKLFSVWSGQFLFKGSISQSLISSISGAETVTALKGQKYILFLNYLYSKYFSVNVFVKQHILSGASELSITRYGLGLGYRFF